MAFWGAGENTTDMHNITNLPGLSGDEFASIPDSYASLEDHLAEDDKREGPPEFSLAQKLSGLIVPRVVEVQSPLMRAIKARKQP